MADPLTEADLQRDDPYTWPFWAAAKDRRLMVQRCGACGHHQFHPRPFCLACDGSDVGWVDAAGTGSIYSITTIHIPARAQIALVALDEGPRLLARIVGAECSIGARVKVGWTARDDAPPFPHFSRIEAT